MVTEKEYFAFISYQREDEEWAKWLAHELEHYHFPVTLNGRKDLPKDLRPIFRDIDELSAGNLPNQIHKALANSKHLIVICSPRSAQSKWVNKEIEEFINMNKTDKIFPFIIDGKAYAEKETDECFPPALRNLPREEERLGGNINEMGRDAAVVKIVAGMLDLDFDILWQRYEREKAEEERKIREQRDNLLKLQSQYLAEKAKKIAEDGDSYTARLIALEALPKDLRNPDRPYIPEAEASLRIACNKDELIIKEYAHSVILNKEGDLIIASSANRIKIWETKNGALVFSLDIGFPVDRIAMSPDGTYIACGHNKIVILNLNTKQIVNSLEGHSGVISSLSYSSDGKYIVSTSLTDKTIKIWDTKSGGLVKVLEDGTWQNYAVFCLGNSLIVSASAVWLKIWNVNSGKLQMTIEKHKSLINSLVASQNGLMILSTSTDKIIRLWLPNGDIIKTYKGHNDNVNTAQFNLDENLIISGSQDSAIKIWDKASMKELHTLSGHRWGVKSVAFSPDSQKVLSAGGDGTIRMWDLQCECHVLKGHEHNVRCATFSPEGNYIASASWDNSVRIWDKHTGKVIRTLLGHTFYAVSVEYSSDGKLLASASYDKSIIVWNVNTGDIIHKLFGHHRFVHSISFKPKTNILVSASDDGTLKWWDAHNGNLIKTIDYHSQYKTIVHSIHYSHDGSYFITGDNLGITRVWSSKTYTILTTIKGAHPELSKDGNKMLVITNLGRTCIQVISMDTYKTLTTIVDSGLADFERATFSPCGEYIVSSSDDYRIRVWDVKTGILLNDLSGHNSFVHSISVSPDGKVIMSASDDCTIRLWDYLPLQELITKTRKRFKNRALTQEEKRFFHIIC